MKISRLILENYKSIKKVDVDGLSDVNMIYGYNNSGKSNLIKFIELLFSRKRTTGSIRATETRSQITGEHLPKEEYIERVKSQNWWDGIIDNNPFIFRNLDRSTAINFEIWVDICKRDIESVNNELLSELKKNYFNDEILTTAVNESKKLHDKSAKEKGEKKSTSDEAEVAKDKADSITSANSNSKNGYVRIRIKGQIVEMGEYDAEIRLLEVEIYDRLIYDGKTYFPGIDDKEYIGKSRFKSFSDILGVLNDSVLLLDNDRFFADEIEDSNVKDLNPRTLKNWLHNISLDPLSQMRFSEILEALTFSTGSSDITKRLEANSPLKKVDISFGRVEEKIMLLLQNGVDKAKKYPIDSYGTGIQQIFYMLLKIAQTDPKILIVEEIELNLSPKYQHEFIKHILKNSVKKDSNSNLHQLIFTTHSPLLCYHDDYIIYQSNINASGESKIEKADKNKLKDFYPPSIKMLLK